MTPAFRQWVDRARAEHIGTVLQHRHIELPGRGRNRAGPCPNCGGTDRFAVDLEKQVFNCRGCGIKGHGAISLVMSLDHVAFLPACETIVGEPPPKDEPKPARAKRERGTKFVCAYDYTDELETVGYQVLRYAEPKDFRQRRPDPVHEGDWINDLDGVRLVPYRLPELIEAISNGHPIYIVEGEKDADNGAALGLVTTTTAMGIAGKGHWQQGRYDEFFVGADVILVPDQDPDPRKGRELARVIAKRLKGIAASVRVLNLPIKDLSDWIEAGGTREAFDNLTTVELVESNGHDHAEDGSTFSQDWQPPGDQKIPEPIVPVPVIYPFPIDGSDIPRRPWVVPGFLLRRHVSVLVAPPGSGKSLLTLQIALMMGLGEHWGGWYPRGSIKTLVINSEDDTDEMRRRLKAAVNVMGYDESKLTDRIAIADQPENIIIAKSDHRTKTVTRTPMVENIVATINEGKFDVVILDPFAECFEGDENSNSELKWAAVLWREIARRTNCAVLLVHHTRKYASGGAGDMDSARGAGALVGVARVVSTVFTMTEQEADAFEIEPDKRHQYLRFDDAKANLSLVTFKARWFFKRTYVLPNNTPDEPADEVGALEPWKPPSIFDRCDVPTARSILLAIDKGPLDKTGAPVGDLFTLGKKGGSKRWAGDVVQDHVEDCADKDAQKLLDAWKRSGVLIEVERVLSNSKGKPRKGLEVNLTKLPGTVVSEETL